MPRPLLSRFRRWRQWPRRRRSRSGGDIAGRRSGRWGRQLMTEAPARPGRATPHQLDPAVIGDAGQGGELAALTGPERPAVTAEDDHQGGHGHVRPGHVGGARCLPPPKHGPP